MRKLKLRNLKKALATVGITLAALGTVSTITYFCNDTYAEKVDEIVENVKDFFEKDEEAKDDTTGGENQTGDETQTPATGTEE